MPERYAHDRPSNSEPYKTIDRLVQLNGSRMNALRSYIEEDRAWEEQNAEKYLGEGVVGEGLVVFWAASRLTVAQLSESAMSPLLTLKNKFSVETPKLDMFESQIKDALPGAYENSYYDISAQDIFKPGGAREIVQENPVGVYGYILRSTHPPLYADVARAGAHAFLPVTAYPTNTLREIAKAEQFPRRTTETLIELSNMFQSALRIVQGSVINPESKYFQPTMEMYQDIIQNGTAIQRSFLLSQVLGTTDLKAARQTYSKSRQYIDQGKEAEFYEGIVSVVEDSFNGYNGEDVYESLGIQIRDGSTVDRSAYVTVQGKKKNLLKQLSQSSGVIKLEDGLYGSLSIQNVVMNYVKNKDKTHVELDCSVKCDDGENIDIQFALGENNTFIWNFLRDNDQVPELFNIVVQAADHALDKAMPQPNQNAAPIYMEASSLRGQNIVVPRKSQKSELSIESAEMPSLLNISEIQRWAVYFPESVAVGRSDDLLTRARGAIDKYDRGLSNLQKMYSMSSEDRIVFRLKNGKVRVLLQLDEATGQLEVIDVDWRKDIYR